VDVSILCLFFKLIQVQVVEIQVFAKSGLMLDSSHLMQLQHWDQYTYNFVFCCTKFHSFYEKPKKGSIMVFLDNLS